MESILTSIKKALGIEAEYTHFDPDIIMHINSAFLTIKQLIHHMDTPFKIEDASAIWDDMPVDIDELENIKSIVFYRVKLAFDPPTSSFLVDSMHRMSTEDEWRANVESERGYLDE